MIFLRIIALSLSLSLLFSCQKKHSQAIDHTHKLVGVNAYAFIEIPAGTQKKYELDKESGRLVQDEIDGAPRVIDYLPYPSNYGMIPNTISSKSQGGDGDPLDILVLGPNIRRGMTVPVKIIGMLKLMDNNEQDDKLIGVYPNSNFWKVSDMNELESSYPGVTEILEKWFLHYKGEGHIQSLGYRNQDEALHILYNAQKEFKTLSSSRN